MHKTCTRTRNGTTFAVAMLLAALGGRSLATPEDDRYVNLLTDKPLLHVAAFEQAPTIDGAIDEQVWTEADIATPFWHFQEGVASKHATWAKMGIDADSIYVAFRCEEAEMAKLKVGKLPEDSMALFANDHVELFLMPDARGGPFYHFSVDVAGNRHDERESDGSWGCNWQAAVSLGEGVWSVEMHIPRVAVGLDDPSISLANFCRTRRLAPGETSAWAKTFGVFHNPARFGRLVYTPGGEVDLTAVTLRQPQVGENTLDVTVLAHGQPTDVVIEGLVGDHGHAVRFGRRSVSVPAGSEASASFPLQVETDTRARLLVTASRSGRVLAFCDASEVALSGARPTPIRRVLGPDAAPAWQWLDSERLRGISYGLDFSRPVPEDGLQSAEGPLPAAPMHLRGQSLFRIQAEAGEEISFALSAGQGEPAFPGSTYALFDPQGTTLRAGLVQAGETAEVTVGASSAGRHLLLVNSGPASWNPFSIEIRNATWVIDARGKSTYSVGTPLSLHSLRDCRLAGMNLSLMAAWQWGIPFADDEGLARWEERVERLCAAAQQADTRLIPYVGWGCSETECAAAGDYTRALTRLSVRGPHPCPVSRDYWERSFLRRALVIAELSKKYPAVVGVGLDPESYYFGGWYAQHLTDEQEKARAGAIYMPYGSSAEKCVCNHCFEGLLAATRLPAPDLPEDGNARFDWIAEKGLLNDLCAYQQAELEKILGDVRRRVHEVNPDLCFAVLLLSIGDNWFCRGMARGLGTPRVPALDFDEGTYTSGYSSNAVQAKLDLYTEWGASVVHGGTLWALKHPPADPHSLSAQMFNFALYGHGCWVWPGSMSLWRSQSEVAGYYSLSGYVEDYWRSMAEANREVDKRLAAPDAYRSPLEQITQRPSIPREPPGGEKNEWAQKPCYPVHVYAGTRLSFTVPPGRKTIKVQWGYREAMGDQTLLVNMAGQEHRLTATVEPDQANVAEIDVPADGCTGWIELQAQPGGQDRCIGVTIEGAKPFFGGPAGMGLR